MKERQRRVILFTVIVVTGSVMILLDIPLILLIPLILATGFVVLVLVGAITLSDIRLAFRRPKFESLKKITFLKRLDEMKFFEKKLPQPEKSPAPGRKKEEGGSRPVNKPGVVSPLKSFLSSVSSLGSILKERSRHRKKVEHINELLDKTVSEKVKGSALAGAAKVAGPGTGSSGGHEPREQLKDQDPFMSLSGDEFDVSLLDGLDDSEPLQPQPVPGPGPSPALAGEPDLAIPEPDIPIPSLGIRSDADHTLNGTGGGLEEFSGLEGGESLDQDFRDLDNLDFDDVDLDIGMDEGAPEAETPPATIDAPPSEITDTSVKTGWIASDAPKDAGSAAEKASTGSDMSSFSKGVTGSDEDMLSSLASEVKHVKKERNLSLLRDLKDFKAPATDIEGELKETCERLNLPGTDRIKTGIPAAKGLK